MSEVTNVAAPSRESTNRLAIFAPPPLLASEDPTAYDDLLARVSGNLKPSDIFEDIWVREIADLIWETMRWRRLREKLLASAIPKVLERILQPLAQNGPEVIGSHGPSFMGKVRRAQAQHEAGEKLANGWASGDPTQMALVNRLLASAGMTMESVVAQATVRELDKIERFDRMIASAALRRDALLREIERRRANFAQRLRLEAQKTELECESVDSHAIVPLPAPANENAA